MNQFTRPLESLAEIEAQERPYYAVYEHPVVVDGKRYQSGTWLHGIKHSNHQDSEGVPFDEYLCTSLAIEAETISSDDGKLAAYYAFIIMVSFNEMGNANGGDCWQW